MKPFISICFLLSVVMVHGQSGMGSFGLSSLPAGGRSLALGGVQAALLDKEDLSFARDNPALADSISSGDFSLQYAPFFGGVNLLNASYAFKAGRVGILNVGLAYLDFGELDETDLTGETIGSFRPRNYEVRVGRSHRIGAFVLGANLKILSSQISSYSSSALAVDLGGVFDHPRADFQLGVVLKNVGLVLSDFGTESTQLPVDLQLGLSFKPRYMPARLLMNASNTTENLSYFQSLPGDLDSPSLFDGIFRHLSIGTEWYLGRAFNLMLGYNRLRNQELKLAQGNFGAGLSFGFLLKLKKLQFLFSRSTYHAAGGVSTFGIQGNLEKLFKKF